MLICLCSIIACVVVICLCSINNLRDICFTTSVMICRDFMIRVCRRNSYMMLHKVESCTIASCNGNNLCKLVHLAEYEIYEVNENVRPFRQTVFNEMKRLAYVLRESFPKELRIHTCTLNMLGECLWPCLTCETAGDENINNDQVRCNKCYILLTQDTIKALHCGHVFCKYCFCQLPLQIDGPLPVYHCVRCDKWTCPFLLFAAC